MSPALPLETASEPGWCEPSRGASARPGVLSLIHAQGGTCVNVGCVPKKLFYTAATLREQIVGQTAIAAGYGLGVDAAVPVDWAALKGRISAYVKRLNTVYKTGWEKVFPRPVCSPCVLLAHLFGRPAARWRWGLHPSSASTRSSCS